MVLSDHDRKVLLYIISRCSRIGDVVHRVETFEEYLADTDVQELVAFNLFQIG